MKNFTFIFVFIALAITGTRVKAQHQILEYYGGGMIVQTNGTSGLIATAYITTTGIPWGCTSTCTNATSNTDGKTNTRTIIETDCSSSPQKAAILCDTLTLGGYDDWYLPAIDQLEVVGSSGIRIYYPDYDPNKCYWYWSSTEYCFAPYTYHAYQFEFCAAVTNHGSRVGYDAVRCVRDFDDDIDTTSIIKHNNINGISVYPTITSDIFTVKFPTNSNSTLTFELLDISGRILLSDNIAIGSDNIRQFDLGAFATGLYYIKISATDGSLVKNFKIQKVN